MSAFLRSTRSLFLFALVPMLSAQEPTPVRTVAPARAAATSAYVVPGRTEPIESARVFTRATGIVRERAFDIGDVVKAGDILAVIDVPELDRAVDAARASVEQATVRARNTRTLAERSTSLLTARAISQEEADQRLTDDAAAAAALRVAEAELARLEEQRKFATVRAPFDAVIAGRNFDRGDRVRGDSATAEGWLFHLVRIDVLRFVVQASPDLALRLSADAKATLTFGEFAGRSFAAPVSRSSRIFDPATGTMRVELRLENPDLSVPAGLTGNATFVLPPAPGTFLVPTNTIIVRAGRSQLATVVEGKVALVDIGVGRNLGAQVEVTSTALSPTSAIIVNPNALLRPGDAVKVAIN